MPLQGTFLTGCESVVTQHGNILDPIELARIEPGKTRLIEVEALFGKPSATGAFDSGKTYYVSQIMEEKPGAKSSRWSVLSWLSPIMSAASLHPSTLLMIPLA